MKYVLIPLLLLLVYAPVFCFGWGSEFFQQSFL